MLQHIARIIPSVKTEIENRMNKILEALAYARDPSLYSLWSFVTRMDIKTWQDMMSQGRSTLLYLPPPSHPVHVSREISYVHQLNATPLPTCMMIIYPYIRCSSWRYQSDWSLPRIFFYLLSSTVAFCKLRFWSISTSQFKNVYKFIIHTLFISSHSIFLK